MGRIILGIFALAAVCAAIAWALLVRTSGTVTSAKITPKATDRGKEGPPIASVKVSPPSEYKLPAGVKIQFNDVTKPAGIEFLHFDDRTPMEYIMDSTGAGLAWIDYDKDGLLDLFIVQGYAIVPPNPTVAPTCKMFKNLGGGKFKDVTAEVGLAHVGVGQGVAVGDINNDGYPDLFITCYGKPNVLYVNESDGKGGRRFKDITESAGLGSHPDWKDRPNFSTSAAFFDYNNDGLLDLFVCSYAKIDMQHYPDCFAPSGKRGPCPPARFQPTRCILYKNNGNGTFTDVTMESGIGQATGKALGVVAIDFDDDGWVDLFVANDGVANNLFRNLKNGKFEFIGPMSGCAVNADGTPQAYMGVDADDLTGNGRPDLFVTAFARETNTFFRNEGKCRFLDATVGSGLGPPSWNMLAFGTCFLDVDRDGRLDIMVGNGHVSRNVDDEGDPTNTFKQRAQLFLNTGTGGKAKFEDVSSQCGDYFKEAHVVRGIAYGDYDNDGHMDLALNNSGEPAVLLHNESTTPYHWLRLELQGTKSNRDAVGAKVTVNLGTRKLVRYRKGGGGYCSAHDPRLLIGLGASTKVDLVEIRWPSGLEQKIGPLDGDKGYLIVEGNNKVEPRP